VVSSNFKAYLEENGLKVPGMQIQKNNNNSMVGILKKKKWVFFLLLCREA
jgi:hypothetical protein